MKLSRDSIENIYLTDILLSKDTDSVKRCAIRDFKAGKYYWYGYEGGGDQVRQFFKAYAKKKYGLILISYGVISWTGEEAYNNEMGKLLYGIKMKGLGTIYHEAEKEYRKLHSVYQVN